MRKLFLAHSLLVIVILQNSIGSVTALSEGKPASGAKAVEKGLAPVVSTLTVQLNTATGKTIAFKPQENEIKADSPDHEIPHLVLNRNGVPTPGFERTLMVSVDNLVVPPTGMYVQLVIETQHGDPDLDRRNNVRIRVRKEVRFVRPNERSEQGAKVQFNVTFDPLTELPHKTIKTPTDYYRYRVTVSDVQGNPLQSYAEDYAFLLENQWRVPLPQVLEATPGAAPDELVVYFYDMLPFQSNLRDPDTRIPREEVSRYIQTELVPAMVEAFQAQSNIWGFAWHEEWRNFRRDEDPEILSVALGEHQIWFHGKPASLGHSMISIRVDGTVGEYDNLTDGIMSVFHHELFHNHQRNLSMHYGSVGGVSGKDQAWMVFTEGTAVLASSVGQPHVQFEHSAQLRSYMKRANAFLGTQGAIGGGLNKSYKEIPYHTAIYWRFLYENCGGINNGSEDPSTGMQVIRSVLETLYKGEIVQIDASTDVAGGLPHILDHALQSTPSCKFQSYEESLIHFARAIYLLRLENASCLAAGKEIDCRFTDPHNLYAIPDAESYVVAADSLPKVRGSIPSSYGIDLVELGFDPSMQGKSVKLIFTSADPQVAYNVEIWKTKNIGEEDDRERESAQNNEPVSTITENGHVIVEFDNFKVDEFDGLGLIVTRMDPYEGAKLTGGYSIRFIVE
ncbi:MAG TPA: hypothetical protein VK897_02825 [Anaerolineales bacterium]|nr:hypothetical protein [Anaerolineales bacterium]